MFVEFIKASSECIIACDQCVQSCLTEGKALNCCKFCIDCSSLGGLSNRMVSSKSGFAEDVLMIYAEACDMCAAECEKFSMNYHHCKVCADACRNCAKCCRELILQMKD